MSDDLDAVNRQENQLHERIGVLRRQEDSDSARLSKLRAEAARYIERNQSARPQLARAERAEAISQLITAAIDDLYPKYVSRLGEEMTDIYRQLAHKGLVKKIDIAEDCTVRLYGDKGRDVRTMDASAGEEQIFALGLIAAIAKVSGVRVPIVMDTPLARLDADHRTRVLRYFAGHGGEQVIFLSQPDEVHGPYLAAIKDRVCQAYHIEFEELGDGVGTAHVKPGYFKNEAV